MNQAHSRRSGLFLVAVSAILWSTAGLFVRMADLDTWTIVAWRSVFSFLTLGAIAVVRQRGALVRSIAAFRLPETITVVVAVASTISYVLALRLTTVANVMKAMGPGKKRIAHFTGFLVDPNTQLRIDAVKKAAEESGDEVVQVIADIDAPEPAQEKINAYLAAHANDVDGIVTTAWVPAVVAANALRKIGDKRIKMVGIDHDQVVLQAVKDGFLAGTMRQNPYGQGYIGAYAADKLRNGCTVKASAPWKTNALTSHFIDSGTVFVAADKVNTYIEAMQGITKDLLSNFQATYLDCKS